MFPVPYFRGLRPESLKVPGMVLRVVIVVGERRLNGCGVPWRWHSCVCGSVVVPRGGGVVELCSMEVMRFGYGALLGISIQGRHMKGPDASFSNDDRRDATLEFPRWGMSVRDAPWDFALALLQIVGRRAALSY
ncbi:hypothetical protein Taro_044685 [Colocasia esculenta]|uniref:Uncharacterized protein n=1 Tax=Colocasia esculenta TaxID=4460 RepID=A0A843X348_COLES|nr:hypothetical protein [Colocasia esculenta]